MSKFFLTMDADGAPLPVYDEKKDIDINYKEIFRANAQAMKNTSA